MSYDTINLIGITKVQLRWVWSLIRRIRVLTPRESSGAIAAFLFSQLFALLAFFLPLKAILLLSREGVPWYLSAIATVETKDSVVLILALGAIGGYGLHLICDRIRDKAVRGGSKWVIGQSNKLLLFNNQVELAHDVYLRLCQVAGAGIILVIGVALGIYINSLMFAAFALIVLLEYVVFHVLMRSGTKIGSNLCNVVTEKLPSVMGLLATGNFLIGFAILFGQYLATEQRNIVVAILSILLVRQIAQQVRSGVLDVVYLTRNRNQVDALFYASVPYRPRKQHYSLFSILSVADRNRWLSDVLETVVGGGVEDVKSSWLDSNMPGVAYFEVDGLMREEGVRRQYLIKGYDRKRAVAAAHEVRLFTEISRDIPLSPMYAGDTLVGGSHVLVFGGLPSGRLWPPKWKELGQTALFRLWSVKPPEELLDAYLRAHPTIIDRLTDARIQHFRMAVDERADEDVLESFLDEWPRIKEEVRCVPLVIDNPDIVPASCRLDSKGGVVCFSWSRWRIEPMGYSRLIGNMEESELQSVMDELGTERLSAGVTPRRLLLVSRLFEIERALQRNRLREGLDVLRETVEAVRSKSTDSQGMQLRSAES